MGVAAGAAGLACLLDCFALEGRGTPAPVAQTEVLVASGLYRFVRNPMYVSVLIIVSGQALLFGQARLFAYARVMLVASHLFVLCSMRSRHSVEDSVGRTRPITCTWVDGGHV